SVPSRSLWSSARPQVGQSSPGGETEERGMNRDGEGDMAVMRKERLRAVSFTHKSTGSLSGPAVYPPYHTHTHTQTHRHTHTHTYRHTHTHIHTNTYTHTHTHTHTHTNSVPLL